MVLKVEKSCWFLSLGLWNFLRKVMSFYFWNSFFFMLTCIKIKEEINLDFLEICISLFFIWGHDLLWIVVNFPSFYILLKHNWGRGPPRSWVLPLLSKKIGKKTLVWVFWNVGLGNILKNNLAMDAIWASNNVYHI